MKKTKKKKEKQQHNIERRHSKLIKVRGDTTKKRVRRVLIRKVWKVMICADEDTNNASTRRIQCHHHHHHRLMIAVWIHSCNGYQTDEHTHIHTCSTIWIDLGEWTIDSIWESLQSIRLVTITARLSQIASSHLSSHHHHLSLIVFDSR